MGERESIANRTDWGEIVLTPEIATPEKRLSALLNIAQNGAETLTVLTMASDTRHWEGYGTINSHMNRQVGLRVVHRRTTRQNLIQCIEPVGAAARSTIDDRDWVLTEFGIKIKPALIFFWQKLLGLNLDSMVLLGSISQGKKDENGNFITTPPVVRAQILLALAGHSDQGPMRVVDLCQPTKLTSVSLSNHLEYLKTAGLVNFESAHPESGQSVTFFTITPIGQETTTWPIFRDKKTSRPKTSAFVQEAVQSLTYQGKPITIDTVASFNNQNVQSALNPNRANVTIVLSHFVQSGLLERSKFHGSHLSNVWPTSIGEQVAETIIKPLAAWSQNNQAVAEINQIAARLKINPDAFAEVYPQITASYIKHSPGKNRDRDGKRQQIVAQITTSPGKLTRSDLSRKLNISAINVRRIIKPLIESGEIVQIKTEKGNRIFLSPGPNL